MMNVWSVSVTPKMSPGAAGASRISPGAAERGQEAALHVALEREVRRHADHRARLGAHGLAGFELDARDGERRAVEDLVLHPSLLPSRRDR
jgi:hypothetical protein